MVGHDCYKGGAKTDPYAGFPDHFTQVVPTVYSGAQSKLESHWEALERFGIRTVISVDGARPDLPRAQASNLRYVHIPIGYDGIGLEQARALAEVFRSTKGPWYFHCHHGKHRGPAAAATATLLLADILGWRENTPCPPGSMRYHLRDAERFMTTVGTSENYPGLWRDLRELDFAAIWVLPTPTLVAQAAVSDLDVAMADLDRVYDRLKAIRKAGWVVPADQPDLSPQQEARILREGLEDCSMAAKAEPEYAGQTDFQEWLDQGLVAARKMEDILNRDKLEIEALNTGLDAVRQSCLDCHAVYRNE